MTNSLTSDVCIGSHQDQENMTENTINMKCHDEKNTSDFSCNSKAWHINACTWKCPIIVEDVNANGEISDFHNGNILQLLNICKIDDGWNW